MLWSNGEYNNLFVISPQNARKNLFAKEKAVQSCQRIVPQRIVYMFRVLQLGKVDIIYFMFINCLIPKMLESILPVE